MSKLKNVKFIMKEKRKSDYYWEIFESLLIWSYKLKKETEEYKQVTSAAWDLMDKYLQILEEEFKEDLKNVKN